MIYGCHCLHDNRPWWLAIGPSWGGGKVGGTARMDGRKLFHAADSLHVFYKII